MAKNLIIVESPTKAKTIGKFLGSRYTVKASLGHVRDLPKSQFGVDVEHDFAPKYINIRGKGELLKELREAAEKADKIYLAPDPDREGEAISWHLAHILKLPDEKPCRIEFNEITKDAIEQAIKKPRKVNTNLVNAQQTRRILDRIVGYKLSPLLWRKVRRGLSAGRVQSVAVRLICDREKEINDFKAEEYWTIIAELLREKKKQKFQAKLVQIGAKKAEINDEKTANKIAAELKQLSYIVKKVKKSERKRNPSPPFITSTLQQDASRKIGFTAKKTMAVAQQLYEGLDIGSEGTVGLITYMRTDSTRISEGALEACREFIVDKYGKDFLPEKPRPYKVKEGAQNAHEAIRPTSVLRTPESLKEHLTSEQFKLYRLIWERFVASQMSNAIFDVLTIDIEAGSYLLRATGSTIRFSGFMVLYIEGKDHDDSDTGDEAQKLPELEEGEEVKQTKILPNQHFTQPPPRYTDATLVKALEEQGIGRPSTYAPTIDTIIERTYVVRENKQFKPTELGIVVVDLLREFFPNVVDPEFTAKMEDELDKIEDGNIDWVNVLSQFYTPFEEDLKQAEKEMAEVAIEEEVSEEVCEKCGRNMVVKFGRFGKFLACPGYPECKNAKPFIKSTGVHCPLCNGDIVERKVTKGKKKGTKFFGCNKYPTCSFVTWEQPVQKNCSKCGAFMVKKKGKGNEETLHCVKEDCNYTETKEAQAKE